MRLGRLDMALAVADLRIARPLPKTVNPFYLTPEWRQLMRRLIRARGRRCEQPGCGRTNTRIFGDHIVELRDGGDPLDERNVRLLCGSCHTLKTNAARAARTARSHTAPSGA